MQKIISQQPEPIIEKPKYNLLYSCKCYGRRPETSVGQHYLIAELDKLLTSLKDKDKIPADLNEKIKEINEGFKQLGEVRAYIKFVIKKNRIRSIYKWLRAYLKYYLQDLMKM